MADPKTVLEFVKKNGVKMLDLRFTDLPGLWHHVSYPIDQLIRSLISRRDSAWTARPSAAGRPFTRATCC